MKLNKILKIVLNIAIVIAAFIFIVEASVLKQSGEYAYTADEIDEIVFE